MAPSTRFLLTISIILTTQILFSACAEAPAPTTTTPAPDTTTLAPDTTTPAPATTTGSSTGGTTTGAPSVEPKFDNAKVLDICNAKMAEVCKDRKSDQNCIKLAEAAGEKDGRCIATNKCTFTTKIGGQSKPIQISTEAGKEVYKKCENGIILSAGAEDAAAPKKPESSKAPSK